MRKFALVLLAMGLLSVSGCTLFAPPAARNEMNRLEAVIVDSTLQAKAVADEIEKLNAAREAGELDAAAVAAKLPGLIAEGKAAFENFKVAKDSVIALREQHGIPWWQIALNGALAVASVVFAGGASRARSGIGVLTRAIKAGGTTDEIKKRVSIANHPDVEREVRG